MSVTNPAFAVPRGDLTGNEAYWAKAINPPAASPETPDLILPTNPVPEFMESLGLASVSIPHTVIPDLMHGTELTFWDGKKRTFFLMTDKNIRSPFNNGSYPGPTIRVPRGVIFHGKTHGHGPPPHTIHWHGIEPTPMNDGVGHCSFEVGDYTYQWQPNFIGTYFYHCHRNTVQHFEYGLFAGLIIEPPDAFESGPGKNPGGYPRRTAANLENFSNFPGFNARSLESGDPNGMTVPYDVEAFWVFDDIDSVWMQKMRDARAGFAQVGSRPGVDDKFFKADFHDFNPDYFFVTGEGFPARKFSTGTIKPNLTIPAALNSGVTGMQISIAAKRNQTILIRSLCAAYSNIQIKFPVDVVIIAFDGRSLGIPPYGNYNNAFVLPAGEVIEITTARRFDVLLRPTSAVNSFAEVAYFSHQNQEKIFTGRIPFIVS